MYVYLVYIFLTTYKYQIPDKVYRYRDKDNGGFAVDSSNQSILKLVGRRRSSSVGLTNLRRQKC